MRLPLFLTFFFSVCFSWAQEPLRPIKDSLGKYVYAHTDYAFDVAYPFTENGLAVVKKAGKWFVIDDDFDARTPEVDSISLTFHTEFEWYSHVYLLKDPRGWFLYDTWKDRPSQHFVAIRKKRVDDGKLVVELPNKMLALLDVKTQYMSTPFDEFLEDLSNFEYKHFWVKYGNQIHLTDKKGESESIYDYVEPLILELGYFAYIQDGLWHIRYENRTLPKKGVNDSDFFCLPETSLAIFRKNGKIYFVDGIWWNPLRLIKADLRPTPAYEGDDAQGIWNMLVNSDSSRILFQRKKYGYIDRDLNIVLPLQYDSALAFDGKAYAAVKMGKYWGIINREGQYILNPAYERLTPIAEDRFIAFKAGKYGIISATGEVLLPFDYTYLAKCPYGFIATQNQRMGMLDSSFAQKIPFAYTSLKDLGKGWLLFEKDILNGVYDVSAGRELFIGKYPFPLKRIGPNALSHHDGNRGQLISAGGKILFDSACTGFVDMGDGCVKIPSWGWHYRVYQVLIYNTNTEKFFPGNYSTIYKFHEGLVAVSDGKKYGFLDTQGNTVIPFVFSSVESFKNGKAKVRQGSKTFYIDRTGQKIAP